MSENKIWIVDGEQFIIADSARKHGIADEDIVSALTNYNDYARIEEDPNKYLYIGFDTSMRELEVIIVERVNDKYIVIHAMKARKSIKKLLKEIKDER